MCGLVLVVTGCGSARSSQAAFRRQANGICREVSRLKHSVDFSSASGFARGLAGMRAGVRRLAHVHAPQEDGPAYRDLLAKLGDINALLDGNRATLVSLERRLRTSSGRKAAQTIKHFGRLVRPVASAGLRAAADARALGLGVCATDLSGGAPFAPSPGGTPT